MSKLEEKLKQILRGGTSPMGFGAWSGRSKNPSMLLGASPNGREGVAEAKEGGADLFILSVASLKRREALKGALTRAGDTPLGVRLDDAPSYDEIEKLLSEGVDFVVFTTQETPASILRMEKLGRVLEIDPSWPDSLLRFIDPLPLEALLMRLEPASPSVGLTVGQIILCHRIQGLARKPLLVALPSTFGPDVLEVLREAGAAGVILEEEGPPFKERLAAFRQTIDSLPPLKRRREPMDVMLPLPGAALTPEEEEEEEDDPHSFRPAQERGRGRECLTYSPFRESR